MKVIGKKGISGIIRWCLELVFWGGAAITVSLPISFQVILRNYLDRGAYLENVLWYWMMFFILCFSGSLALVIIRQIVNVLKKVNNNQPFVKENATYLFRISVCSFLIAGIYLVKCVVFPTVLTIVLVMVFVILGFLALVCSELFRQAAAVKQENDLTV